MDDNLSKLQHVHSHKHHRWHSLIHFPALTLLCAGMLVITNQQLEQQQAGVSPIDVTSTSSMCSDTCRIEVVESVPQNISFTNDVSSTFEAWRQLIGGAKHSLLIAAYKTSLRGKHVFGNTSTQHQQYSSEGEFIYEELVRAGLDRRVDIRMVENSPSKDKGDNEDGISLHKIGALKRRTLNLQQIFDTGIMHSKFIIADNAHFYLGSANLDWRSLNQKLEMGVLVRDCPCLAKELASIFEVYWMAAEARDAKQMEDILKEGLNTESFNAPIFNSHNQLHLKTGTSVYLAASPLYMNSINREWDLDSILNTIQSAPSQIDISVMDYHPLHLYSRRRRYWPIIDTALREAIIMRGVNVRMIVAALHYPSIELRFLESLQSLNSMPAAGRVEVKVFKVPHLNLPSVIHRDRRTHKKVIITDDTALIGTSNWSGDYFDKGTGVAIVIQEQQHNNGGLIQTIRGIFNRDWTSEYAHPLNEYIDNCLVNNQLMINGQGEVDYCESEKDLSLLAIN